MSQELNSPTFQFTQHRLFHSTQSHHTHHINEQSRTSFHKSFDN